MLTDAEKQELRNMIADSQEGGELFNDHLGNLLIESVENSADVQAIRTDIQYNIYQLNQALDAVRTFDCRRERS